MAKVFVDANYFIGLANRTPETDVDIIHSHQSFVSILTIHILFCVNKIKTPDNDTNSFISDFNLIVLDEGVLDKALFGPTNDLEDNIQLHSAAEADCDFFLTNDKKLLKMKFFGKTRIGDRLGG